MKSTLEIKNQEKTDFCLGCAIASFAEKVLGEPCDEAYSYAAGKKFSGQPLKKWGVPPKAALMGVIKYGVLPSRYSPYSIAKNTRDFLADWNNWKSLEKYTVKPFKSFKKIRWNIDEVLEKDSLILGVYWQQDWDNSPYIGKPNDTWNKLEPHEVLAIGMENNYLVIQNSKGVDKGDNGLWYLPKESYNYISHAYILSDKPWRNKLEELIARFL
jgi:hypothetical protein